MPSSCISPPPIFILLLYISPNQGLRRDLSPHTSHLHLHITPSSPHVTNYLFVNHVSPLFIASHHCTCDLFHPVSSRILSIWSYTYCLDLNTAIPSITMGFAFPLRLRPIFGVDYQSKSGSRILYAFWGFVLSGGGTAAARTSVLYSSIGFSRSFLLLSPCACSLPGHSSVDACPQCVFFTTSN